MRHRDLVGLAAGACVLAGLLHTSHRAIRRKLPISSLPTASAAYATDVIPATQGITAPGTGITRGITLAQVAALLGGLIGGNGAASVVTTSEGQVLSLGLPTYRAATLPALTTSAPVFAWCSDALSGSQASGSGAGALVVWSGGSWWMLATTTVSV